ncbi:TlpA disulfide reductase family protein [Pedobacter sp. JY14-1]|uniref:TlpA disulfide reductase family protein n=1 Tax=Pedobacter sp. JY14-1 TaxID=3034151 RepID=UPI0023E3120D|nr:TlpA disulfide reductase family protein [Pedobacter sp. JY14-1]
MKPTSLFALAASLLLAGSVQAQSPATYKISGKLDGLDNQMVYLNTSYGGRQIKDSVVASGGRFSFKGETPGTVLYFLQFGKKNYFSVPVGAKEHVKISGKLAELNKIKVTGSKDYIVWKEWTTAWNTITARAGGLYKQLDSLEKLSKATGQPADRSAVNAEFDKLNQRLIDSVEALVKRYPGSGVVPFIITDRFINYPNPEKAASTYAALTPAGKESVYGRELGESLRIAAKTGIGVSPSFSVPGRDGGTVSLAAYKGKVVLVDFWASWCGPCRKENPNLVKAYEKYHGKGFEIIGISLDDKKDKWLAAIEADQLGWVHASDLKGWKSDLALEYGIRSIPMNFLVDANGKIIAKDLRGVALEKQLEKIYP